jgi:hypothetical protein
VALVEPRLSTKLEPFLLACGSLKASYELNLDPGYIWCQNSDRRKGAFAARCHRVPHEHCSRSYRRILLSVTFHAKVFLQLGSVLTAKLWDSSGHGFTETEIRILSLVADEGQIQVRQSTGP